MSGRLFVSGALINGTELEIDGEQARYVGKVLRSRVGDTIEVFNGEGVQRTATLLRIGKSTVVMTLGEHIEVTTESALKIHLVQGISRGERMDWVVQKATELGVKRISPILTEYSTVKLNAERANKRRTHWQKVAQSACEQSGRVRLPLIDAPVAMKKWFGGRAKTVDVQLILKPDAPTPLTGASAPETKACVLIGPEGGFSEVEYADAEAAGFKAVSLGPRILRTESAAVAALAVLQAMWGDFR